MPLPNHDQVPASLFDHPPQDQLPTADSLFGDSGPFLSQPANGPPPPHAAIANSPVRPPVRPPPNPATVQPQQFRPIRPIRPVRPPMHPPHVPMQRPQHIQQPPPTQTRPMLPPQNLTRPPLPRPQDQTRPFHQQNPQQQQPTPANQHSPQLAYQQRPRPQSPQIHPRPYSPHMQTRPHLNQRPPPPHALSPRPTTQNKPQSPPQHRQEAVHAKHAPPTVAPNAPVAPMEPTQEVSHQPAPSPAIKRRSGTLGTQESSPKSTVYNSDTSSLFAVSLASASEKDGLPSADVLFGSGPASMEFFRQPPAPIKYTPIHRASNDDHRQPEKPVVQQQDVDSLFSSPAKAIATAPQHQQQGLDSLFSSPVSAVTTLQQQAVDSLFSATATATMTATTQQQQDVDSLFSSPASAVATVHYQETISDKRLPEIKAITRIPSPQPPTMDISLGGTQDAQTSQSVAIFESTIAASKTADVSAESTAFAPATPRRPSAATHHEVPLLPADLIVDAMNNSVPGSFDLGQKAVDAKVSEATHHQDSSSLFGGSDNADASHFFSGPSAVDSSAFFSGLSQLGLSAAHPGMTSSAHNDAFKPIVSSDPITATEVEPAVEPTLSQDMEPTPAVHVPVPLAVPTVTRDAAASPINSVHTHPVSLRESQRPPHSFRDVPSSQRHDKPQVPAYVQHSPENEYLEHNAHEVTALFEYSSGSDKFQTSLQHAHHQQLTEAQESSDATQQGLDTQIEHEHTTSSSEVVKPSHLHDHQPNDSHHPTPFAPPVQRLSPHTPSSFTPELQSHQESVSDFFSQDTQPFPFNTHGSVDHGPSVSDLFNQGSLPQAFDIHNTEDQRQSVSELFDLAPQPLACNTLKPEGFQGSVSDLFDVVPQPHAFDRQGSESRQLSLSDQFDHAPKPFNLDNHRARIYQEIVSDPPHHVSQPLSFDNQESTSFDLLGASYIQGGQSFDLLGSSDAQAGSPFDLLGAPHTKEEPPFDLLGSSHSQSRSPSDPSETSNTHGGSPFDLLGTSSAQGCSPFDTLGLQSSDSPKQFSWQSQEPEYKADEVHVSTPLKDQPLTQPAAFSFTNQFEEFDTSVARIGHLSEQVDQPTAHPRQTPISPQPQQDPPQPIPLDETLPSPISPGFGRSTAGPFGTHDVHGTGTILQPGSYSIMELSSELAQTPYFSQARESPRLQEHVDWSKATSGSRPHDLSQSMSPKMEVETSAFDQVSLTEDAPGAANSSATTTSVTSPPTKERGLASLLDPSTLSAVEDLLNMPKSAAFERGMSRLFKGVKSSATSMFSSPLGQSPSKPLATLEDSPADTANPITGEANVVPTTSILATNAQAVNATTTSTATPAVSTAATASHPPAPVAAVLPPPPRRTQEKDQSKLPPPPRISHWPAAPDTVAAQTTPAAPFETAPPVTFDWAHKQSNMFLGPTEEVVPDPSEAHDSFSNVVPEVPHEQVDEVVSTTLANQSTILHTPTAPPVLPPATEQSLHFDHAVHSQGSQEESTQHHPVTQGHGALETSVTSVPHIYDGYVEHKATEVRSEHLVDFGVGPKMDAQEWRSPDVAVSKQELGSSSPTVPHQAASPTLHHHDAAGLTLHYHHQQVTSSTPHHQATSPTSLQHIVSSTLLHHATSPTLLQRAVSPTLLQRAVSPSVLDPEVHLRKQAAVHALLADQVAHGGPSGGVRAKPDKKERLLEKARELLEKRQQSSGAHLQGIIEGHSGLTAQKYPSTGSRSSGEWMRQEEIPRRGSLLSRDQFPSPTILHQLPFQHDGPAINPVPASHPPASPSCGPQQQQQQHQTDQSAADHRLALENMRLQEQVQLLLTETKSLQLQIQSQEHLQSQVSRLQDDLARMREESQAVEATHQEIRLDHSRRADDISLENQRLQAALTQAQSDHRHVDTGMNDLLDKYRQLEVELGQARQICKEQETALTEAQRMKEVALENEQLRCELDRTQKELQEQRGAVFAAVSETNARRASIESDRFPHTAEQLSQEAEGLRRQLKGQRQELKELQDSVKRSDVEKRNLFSRIGQLERALADAEKHRNEQKSHQAMKDEAYKVIQERLVASFEEEKAQYLDEEAFKMAKLEHRYNLLQDEMAVLRAKESEKPGQEVQATLSGTEEDMITTRITRLELDLEAARVSEKELGTKVEESIGVIKGLRQTECSMRLAMTEMEERSKLLQDELEIARKEARERGTLESDSRQEHTSALESLSEELQLSLERERILKHELELASRVMKNDLVSGARKRSSDRDDLEQSHLAENAYRWQEECFAAKEETMRVEDQLQRVNLELMAARTEILQLEAGLATDESASASTAELQRELAELRERVIGLSSDIQGRDVMLAKIRSSRQQDEERNTDVLGDKDERNERISALERQLEQQHHVSSRLEKELSESKALLQETHATITATPGSNQSEALQTLLEEERHVSRSQVERLEEQFDRMKGMMLEKQIELQQVMAELSSTTCKLSATEQELGLMKAQSVEGQEQRAALEESLLRSKAQRNEEAAHQVSLLEQSRMQQEDLNQQLSALKESKEELERLLREHTALAETSKQETRSFKTLAEKLKQDLAAAIAINSVHRDEELLGEKENIVALRSEMPIKAVELKQAKEQLSLVADLFRKLLSPSEDPEELEERKGMMTLLAEMQPLGVSIQALPEAGTRFLGTQKEILTAKLRIEELESQLSSIKHQQQLHEQFLGDANTGSEAGTATDVEEKSLETDRLRQDLAKAEHGIGKLQQFLQEFQNEKKRAIYELQQRLEESEEEVAQARSQLAKAQALLLSRSAGSLAATTGTVQSPDISQAALDRISSRKSSSVSIDRERDQALLRDETFKGTEAIHREAVLALDPLRQQKAELERTLLDLRHRYELSQKENDALLSGLERENKVLKSKVEMRSPDMADEHLERIRELELEQAELNRQLKTAQREREFTRQDMRSLKAELAKLRAR